MAMRHRKASKHRSCSSASHNLSLEGSSSNLSSNVEATNTNSQIGSSPSVTSESTTKISSNTEKTSIPPVTTQLNQNPVAMTQRVTSKCGLSSSSRTSNLSSRSTHSLEFEEAKARDTIIMIEMYYDILFYPAKINNPEITNAWAIAHLNAPEIKELGIDAGQIHFISRLEKIKHVKGFPVNLIFANPICYNKEQQRDYMKMLVASLE